MSRPNTIEQELNKIRLQIYEETKDMTIEERVDHFNKIGENAAKKYGFKIVASANKQSAVSEDAVEYKPDSEELEAKPKESSK